LRPQRSNWAGVEYVALGGENATKIKDLSANISLGGDGYVFVGGYWLWTNVDSPIGIRITGRTEVQ
jgi:hypothetical protein